MHLLDRPLLLGLVALEQEAVSPAELIAAFRAWRTDPRASLGAILQSQGRLSPDRLQALEQWLASSLGPQALDQSLASDSSPTTTWKPGSTSLADTQPAAADSASSPLAGPPRLSAAGSTTLPRFRPLRLHAAGGLGNVYEAEDLELNRRVALKEIQLSHADDLSSRRRFVAEAEITGKLEHPGIVPVYGLGAHADGRPYYAMRFIEGQTLSQAIKSFHARGRCDFAGLEFRQLLGRLVSVCNAVAFAHSRGIVHRDLKPHNVMLGQFGETLVVDWGLAKPLGVPDSTSSAEPAFAPRRAANGDEDATSPGEIIGTPAFMSPEQAAGRIAEIGPRSDIYSLGAVLYSILTGKAPARGTAAEMLSQVSAGEVPDARALTPNAPRALAAICSKAMSRAAEDRYATALDFAADIERWLADEPAVAYREPWSDTAYRWVRKHRLPVAVASALVLAISLALGVGFVVVRSERDVAQVERNKAVVANERAQVNAAAMRDVVEQYLLRVGDDSWSQIPGFEQVRLNMAQLAVERYRQLLAQQPQDLALASDGARAYQRCANLYRMIGDLTSAGKLYAESAAILRRTAAADPLVDSYPLRLCGVLCDQALLILRLEGPVAAEEPMREALAVGRQASELAPSKTAARQTEARVLGDLAEIYSQLGRHDEAVALARQAQATLQAAADGQARSTVSLISAAFSSLQLAQILREAGRAGEAAPVLGSTRQRLERYAEQNETDTNLRYLLAWASLERSLLSPGDGGDDAANAARADALARLEQLAKEFPHTVSFQRKLAEALTAEGRGCLAREQPAEAATAARRAVELLADLNRRESSPARYHPLLAAAYLVTGEAALASGNRAAAKEALDAAHNEVQAALKFNPASPKLAAERTRIETRLKDASP